MKNRQSLLVLLLLPLVSVLTLAVGVVWFFSIQAGEASIERLLRALSLQNVSETKSRLDQHFAAIRRLNEQNARALSQGLIPSDDADAVQRLFWWQAQHSGVRGYLLFGNQNGDFVDVGNPLTFDRDFITERISQKEFGDQLLRSFGIDSQGRRQELLSKPMTYAFQTERWYSEGIKRKTTFWTDVYTWESESAKPPAVAVSSPVFGADGTVSGIVAIEHRLQQLDQVLGTITQNSVASIFIMDGQRRLIASSRSVPKNGEVGIHQHPVIIDALQRLSIEGAYLNFHLDWQGKRHFIGVSKWDRDQGTAWPILVAVPEDAFLQDFASNKRFAVAITFVAWVVLVIFAVALYYRLVQLPVNRLLTAVQRAQQGELSQTIATSGVRELATLASAFNEMLKNLSWTHGELERSNENLERQVQERTSELERLRANAESQARTDPLTGLANRRAFRELAERALQHVGRSLKPLSLIMLDIDHFKRVNDTWGHSVGDQVLKAIATVLAKHLRSSDVAARVGGEEFVILLVDTEQGGAHVFAERLRLAIMDIEVEVPGDRVRVTASFGVAEAVSHETKLDEVLECADKALYHAKHNGRNRVSLASELDA
ncbi:MAG: diguanylate cyclase [Hydrogenophaga sp.]|uniref:sensor domain-containing diguanylate cyclase n=1 Tax=Hydrogenophaga sp. TaxID=1904254 RepID=UPI00274FC67E|nr:diguanylate cyclase [Hydrogenophaga sp.]MDP2419428.1 diguanylate cyclase [Hydrogenophaga sp.]MDZ4188933.1 diguanylate cyclase [Hydrogenophaga sp.]